MTEPAFRSLPGAAETFTVAMSDGAVLPVYGMGGPPAAPGVLFGHANGLAAGSYGPFLARLGAFARVFAFDARGHGGARWPEGPIETVFAVDRMAADLVPLTDAVAARAGVARIAYVGHSLGAVAALRLATLGRAPEWRRLIAFEPPIFPPPGAACYAEALAKQTRLVAGTAKRRAEWPSPAALEARLKGRGMFARFDDAMLRAHCRAILKPLPQGGFGLCCPPAVEAWIFRSHWEADTWSRLGAVTLAPELIGADPAMPDNDWVSGAMSEMAAAIPAARLTGVPGTGHLLILEAPERCAELVRERL
jgi:pimeloyl-ACP methyl ester carboxylesterase